MTGGKILVVDDEPQVRRVLRVALTGRGYEVSEARSGEEALEKLRSGLPDLVLLDLNLPAMNGIQACRSIRSGSEVAIIVLSVRKSEKEKVEALDAGADDYVTKPFGMEELVARIRAALRRKGVIPEAGPQALALNDVEIDFVARRVATKDGELHLTPKEFDLLRYLVSHAGTVIPHRRILQAVWGPDYGDQVEYLRVFVNQLRKKIEPDPSKPQYILTEPWVGYRFVSPGTVSKGS